MIEELKNLFNFKKFNIAVSDDKTNLLVTTDDGKFELNELGDGISHFIIVLGNALIQNPHLILIDEPEIGLHPKLQEVFVRALASKAKFGLLASSHSIGLARSGADNLLSLTKSTAGKLELRPYGKHYTPTISQSINELGYSQFIELGGNNILLVEGRTDVKAFREILRKYEIEQHFILFPLGGSDFTKADPAKVADELNEIKRLNPRSISVIFDSESLSAGAIGAEYSRFKDLCEGLGFQVFPTEFHSTENYIAEYAIHKVLGDTSYKALKPFENFNDGAFKKWDKNKNWLMFNEMSKEDFRNTNLDKFITEKLFPHTKN